MILEVEFEEINQEVEVEFGEVYIVSDGGTIRTDSGEK